MLRVYPYDKEKKNDEFLVDPRAGKFIGITQTRVGQDKSSEQADLVVCSSLGLDMDFNLTEEISNGSLCAPAGLAKLKGQKNSGDVIKFQISFVPCDISEDSDDIECFEKSYMLDYLQKLDFQLISLLTSIDGEDYAEPVKTIVKKHQIENFFSVGAENSHNIFLQSNEF